MAHLNHEQIQDLLKGFKEMSKTCEGSSCMDIAVDVISLMGYVNVQTFDAKQLAYALAVTEMANGSSGTKSEMIMKASDEHKKFLIFNSYSESLMEMSRTLRAKGKLSDEEKGETYGS